MLIQGKNRLFLQPTQFHPKFFGVVYLASNFDWNIKMDVMEQLSKRRGRPVPDAIHLKPIAFKLEECIEIEQLFKPILQHFQKDRASWEVSLTSRDEAVKDLKFLRIFFGLPQSVFFSSVLLLDNFLCKVKVHERFLKVLKLSCLFIAAEMEKYNLDPKRLVKVSQTKCTVADLLRMTNALRLKLKITTSDQLVTSEDFLEIYLSMFDYVTTKWESDLILKNVLNNKEKLLNYLQFVLSDSSCAFYRPSIVAMAILQYVVEKCMTENRRDDSSKNANFIGEILDLLTVINRLQCICKIKDSEFRSCLDNVSKVLKKYDNEDCKNYSKKQMYFSMSTLIRRRRKFYQSLEPILEF